MPDIIDRLVSSPCCNPEMGTEEVIAAYSNLGFQKFEVFTIWAASAFDFTRSPEQYLQLSQKYGIQYTSLHLPPVTGEDDGSLDNSIRAANFAREIGAHIVLFKAVSRELYIKTAGAFLDAIDETGLTPVLQNHAGSPITSLEDFREVLQGINDPRMKTILEVGHFHTAGVNWKQGYDLLEGTIALLHIKDQRGAVSVPFGTGEIDLPGLFAHMRDVGYTGDFVVEMEVEDRENTLQYLADAIIYIKEKCQ